MGNVCVLMADGFEEIEAITVIDLLRRAEQNVTVAGVTGRDLKGVHGLKVQADELLRDVQAQAWDAIIIPGGGPGAQTLHDDIDTQAFLRAQFRKPKVVFGAICAGPMVLAHADMLEGRTVTCYPGYEDKLGGATFSKEAVVIDGNIITSRGPGTAMAFALALVERLAGRGQADTVRKGIMLTPV
jgi:4-methyl-5(b-hydroxyethyl)-thiazole monophosphate biosynthesis